RGFDEVIVVLEADRNAVLFAHLRAFAEQRHHPFQGLVETVAFRNAVAGEDTNHGSPEFVGDTDPVLYQLQFLSATRGIAKRKVIPNAGTTNRDAVHESAALQFVEKIVGWHCGVSGEIIAGGIEAIEAMVGAEINHVHQRHFPGAQRGVEGVRIEADTHPSAFLPANRCGFERHRQRDSTQSRTAQKRSSISILMHDYPPPPPAPILSRKEMLVLLGKA